MPKIKIQIDASAEYSIEDIRRYVIAIQNELIEEGKACLVPPWIVSIVNEDGLLSPVLSM